MKIKKVNIALKAWNKFVFGQVDLNIHELEKMLEALEDTLQRGYNIEVEEEFFITKC